MATTKYHPVSVRLTEEEQKLLKIYCAQTNQSLSSVISECIMGHLPVLALQRVKAAQEQAVVVEKYFAKITNPKSDGG